MLITKQKKFKDILETIKDDKKIFLIGCGECATTCKTGGEKELLVIKQELEKQGKTVTGYAVPDAPCIASQVKAVFAKNRAALGETEAILVFSCGLGTQSVKENDRFGKQVFPGCDTICGAIVNAKGEFLEYCSACGECILDTTGGLCPLTRCPKGLLNGPCGGVVQGKCEVDKEKDCIWVMIYKELEKNQKLHLLKKISPPKDFSKKVMPHKVVIS